MDEVYDNLQRFQQNLEIFNEKLKLAIEDLHKHHDKVNPYWHDTMRNDYDMRWQPLEERMDQYVKTDGANYTEVLLHKVSIIKRYLHGY